MGPLGIVGIVLGSVAFLLLIIEEIAIELVMFKMFNHRGDGCLRFNYPMPSDFENLNKKKLYIKSKKNMLIGFEYKDKSIANYKGIILFSHGVGAGQEYLLGLLNKFCLDGYIVIAYDHSGSMRSTGPRIRDLSQCLGDGERVYKWLDKQEEYKQYDLFVAGHSWGAFTAMNLLNIHKNRIKKCVAIAGFNSHIDMALGQNKTFKLMTPGLIIYDLIHHGKYAFWNSSKALRHTKAEVLCLHGGNDVVVPLKDSYEKYVKISKKHANIHVNFYDGKGHNPFLTIESEQIQADLSQGLGMLGQGEPAYDLYNDYKKTYLIDNDVAQDMLDFLNK